MAHAFQLFSTEPHGTFAKKLHRSILNSLVIAGWEMIDSRLQDILSYRYTSCVYKITTISIFSIVQSML